MLTPTTSAFLHPTRAEGGGETTPSQYRGGIGFPQLSTVGGVVSLSSPFHGSNLGVEIDLGIEISGQTNGLLFRTTFSDPFFGQLFPSSFPDCFSVFLFGLPFRSPFRVHTHGQLPRPCHGAGETAPATQKTVGVSPPPSTAWCTGAGLWSGIDGSVGLATTILGQNSNAKENGPIRAGPGPDNSAWWFWMLRGGVVLDRRNGVWFIKKLVLALRTEISISPPEPRVRFLGTFAVASREPWRGFRRRSQPAIDRVFSAASCAAVINGVFVSSGSTNFRGRLDGEIEVGT